MMVHDIIKIRYVNEGYLPDWPYHLISDEEMIDAFMRKDEYDGGYDFFSDYYPLEADSYLLEYTDLKKGIRKELDNYLESLDESREYVIPDWVYSYMLGKVIGPKSPVADRHDLLASIGLDNVDDSFNRNVYKELLRLSTLVLNRIRYSQHIDDMRPSTIFGEPHILKYIRLKQTRADVE